PGLMPGMTMNFDVPDPALLARLAPGQTIDFKLEFTGKAYRVVAAKIDATGAPKSGGPTPAGGPPGPGAPPPLRLLVQTGHPPALADLHGKLVLLDFVYTHCPGPCPILTGVHADLQRALDPATRARMHFVSISLDPVRDTPAALREYAAKRGADLADWSFLTGPPDAVATVLPAS